MKKSKKTLKIAFIHPDLGIGGAERLVLDVAVALKKQQHEIQFITNHFDKNHAFDELKNDEFPIEIYGDWIPRAVFRKFQALCAYVRMIYLTICYIFLGQKDFQPDLYFIDLIPIAIPFLKLLTKNKKVIYYCHHPDLLASSPGGILKKAYRMPINWLELKSTAFADVVLVNSAYTASVFRETFPEIEKNIKILYPTIAASYVESVNKLRTVKPITEYIKDIETNREDLIVFLSVNRFHPAKRLDFAINAMHKLKSKTSPEQWERIYCILAGGYDPINDTNRETFDLLTELVEKLDLIGKIIFLKSPSDIEKVHLLSSCTALLYTPLKEHFGIVPLEAMLVSKPVIAMNSGGPRETVRHGITGFLCESSAESMAESMYKIVEGNNNNKNMGINGAKKLDAEFSLERFSKSLEQIVNDVIQINNEENNKIK